MSGKPLKMKDLIEVKFTPINDGEASAVIVKQVSCNHNNSNSNL